MSLECHGRAVPIFFIWDRMRGLEVWSWDLILRFAIVCFALDSPMDASAHNACWRPRKVPISRPASYSHETCPHSRCPACGKCQWVFRRWWSTASDTADHRCVSTCRPWWCASTDDKVRTNRLSSPDWHKPRSRTHCPALGQCQAATAQR